MEVSVKVIDKYRKSVQIISENFVVKNNSKYPILFLLNASGTLESFVFEIMDNVTHVVRNITVTIQDVRECPASELSKSKANLSFSSPFILSRNPLIIQPIPLHHTTTRKITLKNPYDENVVFNWDSIQIDGVLKLDVKPKFGLLKPNKCKQMSLMIHALSFPAKLKFVVLSVKFYKEKYFIEYFDTLKELCETERKRSDIYHSGSGDGVTYRELNIEEYRIHACPKPNIQTIGKLRKALDTRVLDKQNIQSLHCPVNYLYEQDFCKVYNLMYIMPDKTFINSGYRYLPFFFSSV